MEKLKIWAKSNGLFNKQSIISGIVHDNPELFKQCYQLGETRSILERYRAEMIKNHYCEICVPIH